MTRPRPASREKPKGAVPDDHSDQPSRAKTPVWHAYLLWCGDGSLYVGMTNDVQRRVMAHNAGRGGSYTRSRRPVRLAFVHACEDGTEARRLERVLKKLPRAKRLALVRGDERVLQLALAAVRLMKASADRRRRVSATPHEGL